MTETLHSTPAPVPLAPPVNTIGRAALIVGIVLGVLQLGATLVGVLLPTLTYRSGVTIGTIGLVNTGIGVALMLVGVVAAVLGLIGLSRPGLPRGAAGAGAALGIATVVHTLFGLVAGFLASAIVQVSPAIAPFSG
jgi:hypothetical protein